MNKHVFLWAAAHTMTPDQEESLLAKGEVVLLSSIAPDLHRRLTAVTDPLQLSKLASELVGLAHELDATAIVQPAGPPAIQYVLPMANLRYSGEQQYLEFWFEVWYANSKRESVDLPQPDGSVKKVSNFRHLNWTRNDTSGNISVVE